MNAKPPTIDRPKVVEPHQWQVRGPDLDSLIRATEPVRPTDLDQTVNSTCLKHLINDKGEKVLSRSCFSMAVRGEGNIIEIQHGPLSWTHDFTLVNLSTGREWRAPDEYITYLTLGRAAGYPVETILNLDLGKHQGYGFIDRGAVLTPPQWKQILSFPNLRRLRLSGRIVPELPSGLFNSTSLELLDLSRCALDELPKNVGSLRKLKELDLSYNEIRVLPASLYGMKHLRRLVLTGNPLPEKILQSLRQSLPGTEILF